MQKMIFGTLAAVVLSLGAAAVAYAADPVCVLHKAGTPAEQYLLVDDDSTELRGHMQHGDTIATLDLCGSGPG